MTLFQILASILLACTDQEKIEWRIYQLLLYILVTSFAKMTAPSFKNFPGNLSIPAALEVSMLFNSFRRISSVVGFNWNLVVMSKSL